MDREINYDKMGKTHQIESARQKKLLRRKLSYTFLLLLILFAFLYLCYKYLFRIVTIEYYGNELYSVEELSSVFGVNEGERLFSYSKKEKEQLLLDTFPYISECEIRRIVPDKITVTISERKGIMYTFVSGEYVIFDKEMYVVELTDSAPEGLLEVKFDESLLVKCVLGEPIIFKDERSGVSLYRVYEALSVSPSYEKTEFLTVKSRFDYYLQYGDNLEVYLGDSIECPAKLLFLQGIVEKLPQGAKGTIDISSATEGYFKEK